MNKAITLLLLIGLSHPSLSHAESACVNTSKGELCATIDYTPDCTTTHNAFTISDLTLNSKPVLKHDFSSRKICKKIISAARPELSNTYIHPVFMTSFLSAKETESTRTGWQLSMGGRQVNYYEERLTHVYCVTGLED